MKSVQNMAYKVILMPPAKRRLEMYVYYTIHTLKNKQAARAILADAEATKKRLSVVADSLNLCSNPILAKYGYRKIQFKKHRFLMIYRIQEHQVLVDGMFHELQDYEGLLTQNLPLN